MEKHSNCAGASSLGSSINNQQSPINNPGWEWYSKEIQAEEHSITLTFAEWVGIHGALRIARKNHQMARHPRAIATEVIERIEELFGEAGMTQTELDQLYWAETGDGEAPKGADETAIESIDNWNEDAGQASFYAYEEEGDRARRRVEHLTRE